MATDLLPAKKKLTSSDAADAPAPSTAARIAADSERSPGRRRRSSRAQVRWRYALGIPLIHVLACLAFFPYFFSWTGVVLADRRASTCSARWASTSATTGCSRTRGSSRRSGWSTALAILGVCTLQDTPACWVAMHRIHHKHSDEQPDPHSPLVNFLWGHCGWLMFKNRDFLNVNYYQRFTRDLLRDPFYMKLERGANWLWIYLGSMAFFFLLGLGHRLADAAVLWRRACSSA